MAEAIVAEFAGGPADGRVQALPDLPQEYRFNVTGSPRLNRGEPIELPEIRFAEYELVADPSRKPTDHYRYQFRGVRRG